MQNLLKTHFGYDSFRPFQEEIIQNVLNNKDSFVLMPTGGGKSLCYQLPALKFTGVTLVISPLIALMKDQVDALKANGIPAAYLNSSLSAQQNSEVEQITKKGKIKILYIAPERLSVPAFKSFLANLYQKNKVSLIAIDEAHCISEWGHDFRPDYRNLKSLKNDFPNIPIIALTATATEKVSNDILQQLNLKKPQKFISGFDRSNLNFSIIQKKGAFDKLLTLLEKKKGESVIAYCFSRKDTENIANSLKLEGYKAVAYHAGLSNEERKQNQDLFIKDKIDIVVATIAFGMGIDKPDVRMVVHYTFPKTLEGYYQEVGRAGRDGLPSDCVLFYSYADKIKHDFFINQIQDAEELANARKKIDQVLNYCESKRCRRKHIIEYFGDNYKEDNCQNCDFCLSPKETFDATEISQKILSAVIRTGNMFGKNYVIDVLRGSQAQKILQNRHDQLPVYGIVQDLSAEELKDIFQALVDKNLIQKQTGQYPTFFVNAKGNEFLKSGKKIELIKPQQEAIEVSKKQKRDLDYNTEVFEKLRILRKDIADQKNVPPFVIFSDVSLQEMAYYFPINLENFAQISGVGSRKLTEYGQVFINLIQKLTQKKSLESKEIPSRKIRRAKRPSNGIRSAKGRYLKTIEMLNQQKSLAEIAKKQGFKESTIMNHIEKLLESGMKLEIDYLKPSQETFDILQNAFEECGVELLRPIYDYLEEQYAYDDIRLARLFYQK